MTISVLLLLNRLTGGKIKPTEKFFDFMNTLKFSSKGPIKAIFLEKDSGVHFAYLRFAYSVEIISFLFLWMETSWA